ncbi:hypothetical protein MBLNU459_g2269t1 [Dothideomycetes sp. NU459]
MIMLGKALSALAALAAVSYAAPTIRAAASTGAPFEVTHIASHRPSSHGNHSQDITYSFVVHDPDPLTNATTLCSYEWPLNGSYPEGGYIACVDKTFSFNFAEGSFKNIYTHTLQIEHTFTDPSVGEAPYDQVTNFGRANITRKSLTCNTVKTGTHAGELDCVQAKKSVIKANIWATIA